MPTYASLPLVSSVYSKNVWAAKQFPNKHLGRGHRRTTNDADYYIMIYKTICLIFHIYNFMADEINTLGIPAC